MASVAIQREAGIEVDPAPDAARLDARPGSSRCCSARTRRACGTCSPSRATRPRRATIRAAGAVYDVDAIGLVELMARLNDGTDFHGRAIDAPDVVLPRRRRQPDRRRSRARGRAVRAQARGGRALRDDAGRLRPRRTLESFLERLGGSPIPLLVGVWPIRSLELAVRVHNETPGIVVPDHVQERYRAAGADAAEVRRRARRASSSPARASSPRACTSSRRSGGRSACSTLLATI